MNTDSPMKVNLCFVTRASIGLRERFASSIGGKDVLRSLRVVSQAPILGLVAAAITVAGCQSSLDQAEQAEVRVTKSIQEAEDKKPPPPPQGDPKPRLVVDVTLSMAGYIAPPGTDASEFSRALEAVASVLPDHQLFAFGQARAGEQAQVDALLARRPAGLGREFATDELFRGPNNQDDLLFRAVGREARPRPLVLFTDGVYSSPEGQGIQPVAQALDELLQKNWSLGIIAIRSAYYGTRCELIPGRRCGGGRLFYSEARAQRGEPEFIPLPCSSVRGRPFYVLVLSPTTQLFDSLYSLLAKRFGAAAGYVFAGDRPPIKLVQPIEPMEASVYAQSDPAPWLMLDQDAGPEPVVRVRYSLDPRFPVARVAWTARAEQASWNGSEFGFWEEAGDLAVEPEGEDEDGPVVTRVPERLPWRSFTRDLEELRASFITRVATLEGGGSRHESAVAAIRGWQPNSTELKELYCEYLNQPSRRAPSQSLSMLRILLAMDALRRQQPAEVPAHLGALLVSTSGSENDDLVVLARDLARSTGGKETQGTTLAAATGATLPAGRPAPAAAMSPEPSPAPKEPPTAGTAALRLHVPRGEKVRTYRFRLVPRQERFAPSLERLSTGDDSDIAFADRTYRLESLIEHLATAQLERIGARGDLTVYLTVPGR